MSEYSQQIKRDIDNFQMAVQKLGTGIKAASALWRDPKYSELSSEMTQIANLSKTVLTAGDKSCEAINILRNGSKCGVYTLICHNPGVTFSRYESIEDRMEQIAKYCVPIDYKDNQYILLPYNLPIKLPQMMDAKATNNFTDTYFKSAEVIKNKGLSFTDILDTELFSRDSAHVLDIPIGLGDEDAIISLRLGEGTSHHGLIGGGTGGGKSTLLHTIILKFCIKGIEVKLDAKHL